MKKLRVLAQVALFGLCLWPVGRQVALDWTSIRSLASTLQVAPLVASGLLLVGASFFLPAAVAWFTHGAARRIGYRDSAIAYFGSQPMKYLPGSFWILPGRVALLRRMGHDSGLSAAGLLFEMTTQVLSSALVVAVLLGLAGFSLAGYAGAAWLTGAAFGGSLLIGAILLVAPGPAQRLFARPKALRQTLARLAEIPPPARLRNLAVTVLSFAVMWCLMAVSFYMLLVAGNPRLDARLLVTAAGVSTLSWLAGFLTPFSPGGIGVREAVIVMLLTPVMPGPEAALVALLSRALALAIELAFAAAAWLSLRAAPDPRRANAFAKGGATVFVKNAIAGARTWRRLAIVRPARPLVRTPGFGLGRIAGWEPGIQPVYQKTTDKRS